MSLRHGLTSPRFDLRWLIASPLLVAACVAGVVATVVLGRAVDALNEAGLIRAELETTAALVVAEILARDYVSSGDASLDRSLDLGRGIKVHAEATSAAAADRVSLCTTVGDRQFLMDFPVLSGGVSPVFGGRLTAVAGQPPLPSSWSVADRVGRSALPAIEVTQAIVVRESLLSLQLDHDPGIALLQLPAGTDRRDFVIGSDRRQPAPIAVRAPRVVIVAGNLWVERGARPLERGRQARLAVVVRGNLYVGRSIEVFGPGQLTIVTSCSRGTSFADVDGDGRWSEGDRLSCVAEFSGPLEGAGNVYLGMPRDRAARLFVDAGLFVGGELHLAAAHARVHGPVVLCHGGTVLPGSTGVLSVRPKRKLELQRASIPGFATIGGPRPGRLRATGGRQQSLYPTVVNR